MSARGVERTLAALAEAGVPRGVMGLPIKNRSLLDVVRAAVHDPWPPGASTAPAAAAPTAATAKPAADAKAAPPVLTTRTSATPVSTARVTETIDWGAVADKVNAAAGLGRGPNPQAIYASRRATVAGQPPAADGTSSQSRSGVDPGAVYASRREQTAAVAGGVDWDAIAAAENAKLPAGAIIPGAARSSGLDAAAIYDARHAQTDAGGANPRGEARGHGGAVPKLTADPARTAGYRTAFQTYAARRAQSGAH